MKTSLKRVIALILAALIVLGTVGYLFSMIAYAADAGTMNYTIWKIKGPKMSNNKEYTYSFNNQVRDSGILEAPVIKKDAVVTFRLRISDTAYNGDKISIIIGGGSFAPEPGSVFRVFQGDNAGEYEVDLPGLKYNGTGNALNITISGTDSNYYFSGQMTIAECQPIPTSSGGSSSRPNDDDDDPDPVIERATPYVIISNYDYGGIITAGETFPLTITLYNTSKNIDVENMMVTITMPEAFMLTSSSNTVYIEELKRGGSVTNTMNVTAKANADPQSHNIDVSMKYQYIDDKLDVRKDNSTQEIISIPVVQVDRFQLTGVDVPVEIYVGEESYLSVNFVNKGRSEVYNLSAEISGDIQNPGQQQNLGNLASGATGSADFYVTPNGEGVCSGEVIITYEDTNMEEKTATILWSTNVIDPFGGMDWGGGFGDFDYGMMDDPGLMDQGGRSSLPWIVGGVGVAAAVAGVVVYKRYKRKKREAEDADL